MSPSPWRRWSPGKCWRIASSAASNHRQAASRFAAPRTESEQLWFAIDDRSTLAT
jgi:hypothetical protein